MSVPVEPTFEFIQEDDIGIVVCKNIAPAVEGALRPKLTPLGLYPADNPVLCWGDGRNEYVKGLLRVCVRAYKYIFLPSHFLIRRGVMLAYTLAHLIVPATDEGIIGRVAAHGARAVRVGERSEKGSFRAREGRGEERTGEVQGSHRFVVGDGRWEGRGVVGRKGDEGRRGFLERGFAKESGSMGAGAGEDEEEVF